MNKTDNRQVETGIVPSEQFDNDKSYRKQRGLPEVTDSGNAPSVELKHNLEMLSATFRDLAVCNSKYQYELHRIADSIYALRNQIHGQNVENSILAKHLNTI